MSEPQLSYVSALIAERDDLRARVAELETEVHRAQTRAQAMHDLYAELEARWASVPFHSIDVLLEWMFGESVHTLLDDSPILLAYNTLDLFYDAHAPKETAQ